MGNLANPEIVQIDTDILIIGGGMAACGAAYEARAWAPEGMRILLVDKAALARSGAVAMGLSAINVYLGDEDPADYARMVANDLMGITRDDLTYDLGRHVDDSVHLFEEWGLPIWKQPGDEGKSLREGGQPVRSGRWQIMIHGESYKPIVAEAARKALGEENIQEHVQIVKLLLDANHDNRICGAIGLSARTHTVFVYTAKAVLLAAGGASNIFRPRALGEGTGRTWYPPWSAGSTYAMAAEVGAELTMMENRFVPTRFKDGYGPVGAWFLHYQAKATNCRGNLYMTTNQHLLDDYPPYGQSEVPATCLRNHLMLHEMRDGRGPIYIRTDTALQARARLHEEQVGQQRAQALNAELEAHAWEDFLGMCTPQAGVWAGENIEPEKSPSELMPTEPYLLGSHAGCCGLWVSGPADIAPPEWQWGYRSMTTVEGLFSAGDGVGASGHKFSSGSHAEGRIAGKAMVKYCLDHADFTPTPQQSPAQCVDAVYAPVRVYLENKGYATSDAVNPHWIRPDMLLKRLQKIMDEYVGGVSTQYCVNDQMMRTAIDKLQLLKEDARRVRAKDLHELMRAWETTHRILVGEAHARHMLYRKETRYPGFYYNMDHNFIDEHNWKCFVNSKIDPTTGEWRCFQKAHQDLIPKSL
ncbi:adenylyl-sulfate reductase subunit alpha [Magnetofaba australis]|uniref:Putative dissimilatory adenylylsulfate reductase alpha subunit n=1 Tax=Magnetofaba australis IT-1 TaxID=1434232 RepID=A0A1Y2K346_9PROT|nr:adenylyl-sulfate reductase subunit alpha [Magnetofaba australis]OSM02087.1 putative dissimilatory adenylylsulfate reductase alpha subunit precursor [Magnetofaba australis IT-1]